MNTVDRLFCYVGVPVALLVFAVLGGLHTDLIIKVRSSQGDLLARINENRRDLADAMSAVDDLQAKCKNCDKSCSRESCGGCCCGEGCKCCSACSSIPCPNACCPSNKGVGKECKCKECKCCCCCKGRQAKPVQKPLILPPPVPGPVPGPCKKGVSERNSSKRLSRVQEVVGGNIYMEWVDNNGEYQNQIVTPEKFQTLTQGSK